MGWVISGGGPFLGFLGFSGQERTGYSVPSVGSARSQLFMPGLHHAHTLQHPKSILLDAHPRESVLNKISLTRKLKEQDNTRT